MRTAAIVLAVSIALAVTGGCSQRKTDSQNKVQVVATLFALADMAKQIGGDRVAVTALLPAGQSPHSYTATPETVGTISQARLLILAGMGIDDWALAAARRGTARGTRILVLTETAEFRQHAASQAQAPTQTTQQAHQPPAVSQVHGEAAHDHADHDADEHGHHHHGAGLADDPHVWLDLVLMQGFTQAIADELCAVDPAGSDTYRRNAQAYIAQLQQLDQEYSARLAKVKSRTFITFHPAFARIAARYNLHELSLHDVDAGGFGPAQRELVLSEIRQNNIKAIFAEPDAPMDKVQALTAGSDAHVAVLDPLEYGASQGYDTYLSAMRRNLDVLVEGLEK